MSYNIGLRLRNLRKAARLSQEQTALAANITPAYLGQIERNEKNPTILTIEKLCTVFNISLSEFFSNHKPASNDDVFLNRITVMLSNRTDVEKEKIYRLIKTALSLSDTDWTEYRFLYSVSFIIFTHLDNLRPIKKFYKKNFLSTDKVKRKFTYRVTKISDINESIKIFLTICRMPLRKVMFSVTLYLWL